MAWTTPVEQSLGTTIDPDIFNDQLINNLLHLYAAATDVVVVTDEKSSGTDGGTATSGSWAKRTITEKSDANAIASVASSVLTLAAGTYVCYVSAPARGVGAHQIRVQNTTAGTTLVTGSTERAGDFGGGNLVVNRSHAMGTFTLSVQSTVEIQHQVQTTVATSGLGIAASFGTEVYTIGVFLRISQ